ncbi:MAG: DUF5856 family protein [Verrucomicrobiales bacterium]|nr:DUF5856 family protein [Verrucomicrobiales bacterium]
MLTLVQQLIAFKYSAKLAHWKTTNYTQHLLYDRLQEGVDDLVDEIAEQYFMASGQADALSATVLEPKLVNPDVVAAINSVLKTIDTLVAQGGLSEGINSLITDIASQFLGKLALAKLK